MCHSDWIRNGYHAEYEHDVIGILANMFNEGDFTDAHALLDETDRVVGTNTGKTLSYGFGRLKGLLPADTFGGYPGEGFWSTAYNGAYGAWGLGSSNYRDEGILS